MIPAIAVANARIKQLEETLATTEADYRRERERVEEIAVQRDDWQGMYTVAVKRAEEENERAYQLQHDSSQNAPWLSTAHLICTDKGIPMGRIDKRLLVLRELLVGE